MKFKRILSVILALALLASTCCIAATAEEAPAKTYKYVAFGDSISAGYGLSEETLDVDPSLFVTEKVIANPVKGAYPAVFGEYLKRIGEKYGCDVTATNLSAPGYTATDLNMALLNEGYMGEIAPLIDSLMGEGASAPMEKYHDLFLEYLEDADLVSIMIGINNVAFGLLTPLITESDNIVVSSLITAFSLILLGYEPELAVGYGISVLIKNKDKINEKTVTEAIEIFKGVMDKPAELIEEAVVEIKKSVEAIKSINSDADIALLSQFNVWGNSLELNDKEYNIFTVANDLLVEAISIAKEEGSAKDKAVSFASFTAEELAYPLQYLIFGQSFEPNVQSMNEKIAAVAEETGAIFVNIYEIDNHLSLDPHPNATMHRQIADHMLDVLYDEVCSDMSGAEVSYPEDYTVTRISHPENQAGDVDGLLADGDRGTSYTWRMAQRGDDIYIATYRHLLNGVVSLLGRSLAEQGISMDTTWALTNVLTNGEFPAIEEGDTASAFILKYNIKTGEFSKVFTFRPYEQCRMVVNYEDEIYAGTFSSVLPDQYLYKIDESDEVTQVLKTSQSFSIRANCVYDAGEGNHLYFAGADEREELAEGDEDCCKVAVWEKDAEDDTVWNRVADYRDFYDYTRDSAMKNNTGCPVWELANHNGYIYAGMPYSKGFIIFRGRPAQDGEDANEYGWIWEEVVGEKNGVNNPGMADTADGHADQNFSAIVSVYEFNGDLYAFDFDQTIMAALAFIQQGFTAAAGADVSLSDMVAPVYRTLNHTQTLWKLNDKTGEFEVCEGFTELMKGTCNEYVWRAQEHEGYMYVSTMDSAVLYNYMTWMTNGYLCSMTPEQIEREIGYVKTFIELIEPMVSDKVYQRLIALTDDLSVMLKEVCDIEVNEEDVKAFMLKYESIMGKVKAALSNISSILHTEMDKLLEKMQSGEADPSVIDDQLAEVGFSIQVVITDDDIDIRADEEAMAAFNRVQETVDRVVDTAKEKIDQALAAAETCLSAIEAKVTELIETVDWEGMSMYIYVSETVRNDSWGFDIVRTKDGVNFEVVTDNGFGDRYNYGSAAFLSTDNGLYIGTCNPFYGGQLYLLTTVKEEPAESYIVGDVNGDGEVTNRDTIILERYISGWEGYDEYITNMDAADLNRDGEVTNRDIMILDRYIAGWEGYEQYIITVAA